MHERNCACRNRLVRVSTRYFAPPDRCYIKAKKPQLTTYWTIWLSPRLRPQAIFKQSLLLRSCAAAPRLMLKTLPSAVGDPGRCQLAATGVTKDESTSHRFHRDGSALRRPELRAA